MKIISNETEEEAAVSRLAMKTDAGKYELEKEKKLLLQEVLNVHCDQKRHHDASNQLLVVKQNRLLDVEQ